MKNKLLFFLLLTGSSLFGQFPEGWDTLDQIIQLRTDLKAAIREDNPTVGANISQELRALSDQNHLSLMWDERWLVYHWCGRYNLLLDELATYDVPDRIREMNAKTAPADSLFEWVDLAMYQRSGDYLTFLQQQGLTDDAQLFADIHLQYLLRNTTEEEKFRRDSFLKLYPNSRFAPFIKRFMTLPEPVPDHYFSLDIMLVNNNWNNELDLTLFPGWGAGAGIYYHKKRFVIGGKFSISRQKLHRNIYRDFGTWPEGSASRVTCFAVDMGLNVLNRPKIRVMPGIEAGWAKLISTDVESDADNPDDYPLSTVFDYTSGLLGVSVTTDVKMFKKDNAGAKRTKSALYNGFRVKVGYNWLYFGNSDYALSGNLLFFALGYQFSGR